MHNQDENDSDNEIDWKMVNLNIGVIPEITQTAGLNNKPFDATISNDLETWFCRFRRNCAPGMQSWVVSQIKERLAKDENPLLLALKLYANCPECMKIRKNSAGLLVMKAVSILKKSNPEIAQHCTDNLRMVAFNFMKMQGMYGLYQEVVFAYDLVNRKHLFMDKLRDMLRDKYYKEVAQLIILLELTDEFTIFDVVLPLILQDKLLIAEEYLDVRSNLQIQTVKLLDSLYGNGGIQRNLEYYVRTFHYTEVRFDRLEYKPLKKLITRLVTKYNISYKETPNLQKTKAIGFIKHLAYKRYTENMIDSSSWKELIMENVGHDEITLQYEVINSICSYNDFEEVEYWARYYKFPKERLPKKLLEFINRRNSTTFPSSRPENSRRLRAPEFYDIKSKNCTIVFVDNPKQFESMIICLKSQEVIGFDSEWKPMMYEDPRLSLIQIATRETVYLIDVLANFGKDLWTSFSSIFNSECVLKLGFSLENDLSICTKTIPELTLTSSTPYFLDIQKLWKDIRDRCLLQFPYRASIPGETLSILVEQCFGKPMNKKCQFSNWGKRPLRDEQLNYAAADAYCLLEIYDTLTQELDRIGYNAVDMIDSIIFGTKAKPKKKKKKTKTKDTKVPEMLSA